MTSLFARMQLWLASIASLLGCSPAIVEKDAVSPIAQPGPATSEPLDENRSWVATFQRVAIDRRVSLPEGVEEAPEFAALPDERRSETELRLEFGGDYLVWETPEAQSYLNFTERTWRRADRKARSRREGSLFSVVSFRVSEVYNRYQMRKLFSEIPALATRFREPFAIETELGMQVPVVEGQPLAEVPIDLDQAEGRLVFRHGGRVWVEFEASQTPLARETRYAWRMFLAHECKIHPAIRRELERQTFLPRRLTYRTYRDPRDYETTLLLTDEWRAAERRSPAPPAECVLRRTENERLAARLESLAQRKPLSAAEAYEQADRFIRDAGRRGRSIEAFLAAMEFSLQTGDHELSQRLGPLVRQVTDGDPVLRRLAIHREARTDEQLRAAVAEAEALDHSRMTKGHMLDLHLAGLYERLGAFDQAEKSLLAVLEANPELVGAWCGLGEVYQQTFRHADAWECAAAARRLAPRHPQLQGFDVLESKLLRDFPDYF